MAKQAKTAIKKGVNQAVETKNWSRIIRAVKSKKTNAYTFTETMVNKDKVKDYLAAEKKKEE